jgi:lipopolysaccharide/colanic/teichoic acid biosynthesis glycosyltransferase
MAVEREYAENYSLGKDLKILLRTVVTILKPKGAF